MKYNHKGFTEIFFKKKKRQNKKIINIIDNFKQDYKKVFSLPLFSYPKNSTYSNPHTLVHSHVKTESEISINNLERKNIINEDSLHLRQNQRAYNILLNIHAQVKKYLKNVLLK